MPRTLFAASLLALSCLPLHAQTAASPPVFSKGPVPLALLRQSWIEDFEAGRLLSAAGHYAPDAHLLRSNGDHAEGVVAIRQFYSSLFEQFVCAVKLTSRVTSQSGDLAYDSGSYHETLTDRDNHQVLDYGGDYLTIYRHFGLQWLIVQQAFTQAAAPSAPVTSSR